MLRELDSGHPVWMNHAPRNQIAQLAAFNEGADIVGCDIYPIPRSRHVGHSDIMDTTPSSVGGYTDRMQMAAPGKPVWMVLQGFGWKDLLKEPEVGREEYRRRPNLEETRFMAFDAIVHGARGILYWGTMVIEKDSQLWGDLMTAVRGLHELQPVLSAPDAELDLDVSFEETYGSVDRTVRVLPKDVGGKTWLLVVNEWQGPLHYTLRGLDGLDGTRYKDQYGGEEAVVEDGALRLHIQRHGVQVLAPQ